MQETTETTEIRQTARRIHARIGSTWLGAMRTHYARRIRRSTGAVVMLGAFAVSGSELLAQGSPQTQTDTIRLSLAGARVLAIRANPELRASRFDIDIARGELRQAELLLRANPEADVLAGGAGAEIGLGQEIEIAGQRGARRAAATAGLERATASVTARSYQTRTTRRAARYAGWRTMRAFSSPTRTERRSRSR